MAGVIGFLAAVVLGGLFGSASVEVVSETGTVLVVDIEVEAMAGGASVVAHLEFDNERPLTLPLIDRGGGSYGITTELEPKNYVVVFEIVGEEASDPVTFTELGADLGPESGVTTTTQPGDLSTESQRNLWLAIALGAASLSVLAFWVLGGRDKGESDDDSSSNDASEEEE